MKASLVFLFLTLPYLFLYTNCGSYSAIQSSSSSAQSINGISLMTSGKLNPGDEISFSVNLNSLPDYKQIIWDNMIEDKSTGEKQFCAHMSSSFEQVFILKCDMDGELTISLTIIKQDGSEDVRLMVVNVGSVSSGGGETDSGDVIIDPKSGEGLYENNCASCHNSLASSEKRGATLARLNTAISSNQGGMGSLSGLTQAERQKIIDVL